MKRSGRRSRRLLLLHTGGTVGMKPGKKGLLRPAGFARALEENAPDLARLGRVEVEIFANLDSSDILPSHWTRLARRLAQRLGEPWDGIVVTHGTDTMAYTASALSFMLQNLPRPVVLTGAQRPIAEVRSDARSNLVDACIASMEGPPEVMICFDSKLFRGNRCTKVKVADYDAFESPNLPPLGSLGVQVRLQGGWEPRAAFQVRPRLEPQVSLLKLFPGISPAMCLQLLESSRGLVIEAFGSGNFPQRGASSLLPLFQTAQRRRIPVVLTSQAHRDGVDLSLYEAGHAAQELGAISGGDMTTEACVTKLMHLIAYEPDAAAVARSFETSLAGERS